MNNIPDKSIELIQHSRFNDKVFILGCYEKRITLYSQQIRAFNLVYSLFKTNVLNKNSRVAIVGAGAAGVSAACGVALLGGKSIKIFEQGTQILGLWRSCNSRWLHPNLFEWPKQGWENDNTELPILNWSSGYAANIAKQIEKQFNITYDYFKDKIDFELITGARVRVNNTGVLNWGKYGQSAKFDVIILAVGYGRDGKKNDENTCYWANDNIEVLPEKKNSYFLSGNGDGGIADLLRIRLKGYNVNVIKSWLDQDEVRNLQDQINNIENDAFQVFLKEDAYSSNEYLKKEYTKIQTPFLIDDLRKRLRNETSIYFHSRDNLVYNIRAFPLNRFLLSRLLRLGDPQFEFVFGEINNLDILKDTGFLHEEIDVVLQNYDPIRVNRFVSRHGPRPSMRQQGLKWIDESEMSNKIKARNELDQTGREPFYENSDFWQFDYNLKVQLEKAMNLNGINTFVKPMPFFSTEHGTRLNHQIVKELMLAQDELQIPNKVFKTEEEYIHGLMEVLPHLDKGSTIKALCGNKKWNSNWVKAYFKLNFQAVERGVIIHRLFLMQDCAKSSQLQRRTIKEQKKNGVIVGEVPLQFGERVMQDFNVPSTFGFAIIDQPGVPKQVIIHDLSEDKDNPFTGVKMSSQIIIRFYQDLWNALYRDSSNYTMKFTN